MNITHSVAAERVYRVDRPRPAPRHDAAFNCELEKKLLKVVSVDLKIHDNAKAHHTERYEHTQSRPAPAGVCPATLEPCLVVRRGDPFDVLIRFDRPFNTKTDDIQLVFEFSKQARESRGTRVVLLLSDEDEPKQWGAKIVSQEGETFTIKIFTPPNLAVSKWKFSFDTVFRADGKREIFRHQLSYDVYVLFNPWCADDQVFWNDEEARNEYVLNDTGRVYSGTPNNISPKPWNFGQFEDFVLDVSLLLLEMSRLPFSKRGNSIHIVRKISALVNSMDDNGVLVGNWSGDYSDGTSPSAWNGSIAILEEYWKTRRPVKYGQCWVFSAVVTTICRALGIPSRSVTNFVSAHDTDGSLTIDIHWGSNMKQLEEYDKDSIWNFHVWNEVWMARPDLPCGFGGWQAIDATPQEQSEGIFCAGPASVEAIKQGLVELPYDGTFIFAEVNADLAHFVQTDNNAWQHAGFEENHVGKCISTKGPDGNRCDITDMYKFPEGSQEERTSVYRAAAASSTRKKLYRVEATDIDFRLVKKESVVIGDPFDVILKIQNKNAKQRRSVRTTLSLTVVQYTGVPVASIKSHSQLVMLQPNAVVEVKMAVTVNDYVNKITEMCHMKMTSMSQVEESKQFHCDSDDFTLSKPTINIKVPANMKPGKEYEIEATWKNPLPKKLTKCEFSFEAPGIQRPVKVSHADVPAQGIAKSTTKLTPSKVGETELIVGFSSKELSDVNGTAKVKVTGGTNVVPLS